MKLTYDGEADMAYLYIAEDVADGEAAVTVVVDDEDLRGDLAVDLDADGRVLGIEIFNPREQLRPDVLASAVQIG